MSQFGVMQLFQVVKSDGSKEFSICEIAARRPGGSIGLLIDEAEGGKQLFPEMEFRLNVGLSLRHDRSTTSPLLQDRAFTIGDLMVPKQIGKLKYLPGPSECTLPSTTQYIPIAKVDTLYHGFDVNSMNTAARFVVRDGSGGGVEERLLKALDWFQGSTVYESLPLPSLPAIISDKDSINKVQLVDVKKAIAA